MCCALHRIQVSFSHFMAIVGVTFSVTIKNKAGMPILEDGYNSMGRMPVPKLMVRMGMGCHTAYIPTLEGSVVRTFLNEVLKLVAFDREQLQMN